MDRQASKASEQARHPIQVVSRRTGLSPDVIRVWERRYGAVEPVRSATNRRLYTDHEVERLTLLRRATLAGRSIGDVARMDTEELSRLVEADERAAVQAPHAGEVLARSRQRATLRACLDAIEAMDPLRLRMALSSAALEIETVSLLDDVLLPLLRTVGERWEHGSLRIAQEHLAAAVVRSLLDSMVSARQGSLEGPEIIVTTPTGERHELGALMAAATAASEGWRATHLGTDLPAQEIAAAARLRGASVLALSLVHPEADPAVAELLRRLRAEIGPECPIVVGGRAAPSYEPVLREIRAERSDNLAAFRVVLARLRPSD